MQGVSVEVKKIENNYREWLKVSNLTETELLKNRTVPEFRIASGEVDGYVLVLLGYMGEENFVAIGEQFVVEVGDEEARMDLSLLLLYIANKLDEANSKAMKLEQRPLYFTNITKEFVKRELYALGWSKG